MSSPSGLKERITEDMKSAMRAHDSEKLTTIRLILAAIKQKEIDERITLNDQQVLAILAKMVKQREESITQFKSASRDDLAEKEQQEIDVVRTYLPEPLTDTAVEDLIKEAIEKTSATELKDMGKVMGYVKKVAEGRADMGKIGAKIKSLLNKE